MGVTYCKYLKEFGKRRIIYIWLGINAIGNSETSAFVEAAYEHQK